MENENIRRLEKLMQHSINRRLDANCCVFIRNWIEEERKESKKELLRDVIIIKHSLSFCETEEDILKIENLCTKLIKKLKQ